MKRTTKIKKKTVYEIVEKNHRRIKKLNPTYDEIDDFVTDLERRDLTHGIVSFSKRDDNPLIIRIHDTRKTKFGGGIHIDIISGEYHLMLDKNIVSHFIEFIKQKRNKSK